MASLESLLKGIIAKATEEYTDTATKDPVVASEDDDTAYGEKLDQILAQQELERKQLWDQLYALEEESLKKKRNKVVGTSVDPEQKELIKLMTLDQQLVRKVTTEMENVKHVDNENDDILDIKFREKLELQNEQLQETIEFVKQDFANVKKEIGREQKILAESKQVGTDLDKRLLELSESTEGDVLMAARAELLELQKKKELDMKDMIDFLDIHYPPHPVDNAGPLGDQCELKIIIEQLLNQAYRHPENPYIPLVPGTYWTPYIQTLIKANTAKYHPEDSQLICLEDFRLTHDE